MKIFVALALLFVFVFANTFTDKINGEVYEDFLQKTTSGFTIVMSSYPDFTKMIDPLSGKSIHELPLKERRQIFYRSLRLHSELSQVNIKKFLTAKGLEFFSLWINNVVYVQPSEKNSLELVKEIAKRSDVKEIITARTMDLHFESAQGPTKSVESTATVEWNLKLAKLPSIWAREAEGQDIVVANIDTGVYVNHTGLVQTYRGYRGANAPQEHDFHWWDGVRTGQSRGCALASKVPCDDHGHGSHTIGTQVGRTANHIVGAAYKAKWIACRGFNVGYLSPGAVEGCMQFFLAPTKQDGTGADPSLAPDVISHSYGVPDSEALKRAFAAVEVVGIMNIASAGNSGTACRSITRIPGIYAKSLTVGALSYNSQNIVGFSSRGPGPQGYKAQKPEIAASGERVNSYSRSPNGITPMSGTSMSAPLVSGTIAALWSKFDDFRNKIDETAKILEKASLVRESTLCSSPRPHPNHVYGYGNLDAEKAYDAMENAVKAMRKQ